MVISRGDESTLYTSVLKPRCCMSCGGFSLLNTGSFKPSCCLLVADAGTRIGSLSFVSCSSFNWRASTLLQDAEGVLKDSSLRCKAWKSALWRSGSSARDLTILPSLLRDAKERYHHIKYFLVSLELKYSCGERGPDPTCDSVSGPILKSGVAYCSASWAYRSSFLILHVGNSSQRS